MYVGRFINLDRSPDRRASMEAQLQKLGLSDRYERFSAIDGEDGQKACFQSHVLLLKETGCPVHVLEDDAILSAYVPSVVDFLVSSGVLDNLDIIFTETIIGPDDVFELRELKQLFDKHRADETFIVRDVTPTYRCGSSSYLVGSKNRDRVLAVFQRGLDRGGLPFDLFIRQEAKAGNLKLGCVFPFVTSIALEAPTAIAGRSNDSARLSKQAIDLLRYSFFADRDFSGAARFIAAIKTTPDQHRDLIEAVLGFVVSDQFVKF
jgi:GR25 family glycosyltransferase involved in LPS biosynthesis